MAADARVGGNTGGMDNAGYGADRHGCLDERVNRLARGDIDDGGAHLEASGTEDFGGRIHISLVQIWQQDARACADPPRNC
jgi:hypothetical protein